MIKGIAKSGDLELSYLVEGQGTETVLLIMGLGGRSADWGHHFPGELARRYRVVRFDNRGTGASTVAQPGFVMDDMARDVIAVLDAVGAERAHLVGISMGGMISQLVALDYPRRTDRVVLLSTHFGGHSVVPPTPDAMRLFDPGEFLARGRDPTTMMRHTVSVITAPGFAQRNPELVDEIVRYVRAQPTKASAFMGQLQAVLLSDRSERVRAIDRPTLVVHGKHDALIPVENGVALAGRIPGARLELLDDCGHMPMWEKPEELSRVVLEFLRG